jgi:hypothetical protein
VIRPIIALSCLCPRERAFILLLAVISQSHRPEISSHSIITFPTQEDLPTTINQRLLEQFQRIFDMTISIKGL